MTRTYDRDTKHYDRVVLDHLVAVGQAQYYPAQGGIYVIKTEDGTVAVRQHQIIEINTPLVTPVAVEVDDVVEVRVPSPMDGYSGKECYDGEDTGPGGVVYDSMLILAEEFVSRCQPGTDPLAIVREMLDDVEGEVEAGVREAVDAARRPSRGRLSQSQDDLIQHFS